MEVTEDKSYEEKNASNAFLSTSTDNIKKPAETVPSCEVKQFEGDNAMIPEEQNPEISVDNRGHQISASRWGTITRAFKLGPSTFDPVIPQHIGNLEAVTSNRLLTSFEKRGSLGKLFRHGFGSNSRSYNVSRNEMLAGVPPPQEPVVESTSQHHKRGSLWKVFKHGNKSPNCSKEPNLIGADGSSGTDEQRVTAPSRRLSLSKLLKSKKHTDSLLSEQKKADGGSGIEDVLPPVHLRARSLGKYFRHSKDHHRVEFLGGVLKKPHKKKERPTSVQSPRETSSDEAQPNEDLLNKSSET